MRDFITARDENLGIDKLKVAQAVADGVLQVTSYQETQEAYSNRNNITIELKLGEYRMENLETIIVPTESFSTTLFGTWTTEEDFRPEMIFYNEEKKITTLKFKDGTITQSKPTEDDVECYSREIGFLEALGKYIYGSRTQLVKAIKSGTVQE